MDRADVMTVFGYYGVTSGNSNRRFVTTWGNAYFENGLGTHAEVHFMDREERAAYAAGGVSWGRDFGEIRGWLGSSTENAGILPALYARIEGSYRTSPQTGLVFRPALTYRNFRNGAQDATAELEIAKYVSLPLGSLILTCLARAMVTDPGDHTSASFGAGLIYAQTGRASAGFTIEGGRAKYDGLLTPARLNESYLSVRPTVSFYLTDSVELIGLAEYSSQESYDAFGGYVGLKVRFD